MTLLLLACAGPEPEPVDSTPSVETEAPIDSEPLVETEDTAPPVDTVVPYVPEVTTETIGDQEMSNDWLYDKSVLHTVDITLPHSAYAGLLASPYTYVEGRVDIDGEYFGSVGVRLRGKIGSFRALTSKPKFRVDLNQYVDNQRLWGLESVSLNNSVVDCSYMKEAMASEIFATVDVPASRMAWARVSVNGEDYGTYVFLETQDDAFLRQHWDDGSGNLYDGKYVWYGGYNYTLLDFALGVDHLYKLEEGVDNGGTDISDISQALTGDFYTKTAAVLDWDAIHRAWAAEQWLGQNDGYVLNRNNYRVYFDPDDGKAELVPWDYDYSFLQDSQWGRSWNNPTGNLAYACRYDTACRADWRTAVEDVMGELNAVDWGAEAEDMAAFLEDSLADDPKPVCTGAQVTQYQTYIKQWGNTRGAYMTTFWGL